MERFIQTGKIINTHGIRGEVKVQPWTDSPDFFSQIPCVYINSAPFKITAARTHKNFVLMKLEGIDTINDAEKLKNSVVYADRDDVRLEENQYFIQDVIGFEVYDNRLSSTIGTIKSVMELPASNVFVISGENEVMVPAVAEFVRQIDYENRRVYVTTIEGM